LKVIFVKNSHQPVDNYLKSRGIAYTRGGITPFGSLLMAPMAFRRRLKGEIRRKSLSDRQFHTDLQALTRRDGVKGGTNASFGGKCW
jgi:hypothetical protein